MNVNEYFSAINYLNYRIRLSLINLKQLPIMICRRFLFQILYIMLFYRSKVEDTKDSDDVTLSVGSPFNNSQDDDSEDEFFECPICNVKFATQNFLILHRLKKHHSIGSVPNSAAVKPTCTFCNASFQRRCDMLRHVRRSHTESYMYPTKRRKRTDIEYTVFCDVCKQGYTRKYDMEKHRKIKHPNAESCVKNENVVADTKNEITDNICASCGDSFGSELLLKKHLCVVHLLRDTGKRIRRKRNEITAQHHCDLCNRGFTRKYDMQKHRSQKHPDAPKLPKSQTRTNVSLLQNSKVVADDDKTYYKCQSCEKTFRQAHNFIRHQSIHSGVRPFCCHICGKSFRVSGGLQRHINEHHHGVKKYACDLCGRRFAAKASRDDHRNIHTNNRPFVCDSCGKSFRQKASLHIHKLFHSDVFRFSCGLCGKKFRRASELKVHGYLHTGEKPHSCAICGKKFRLQHDLKRHLKVHDKLTECVCNECGISFRQERYLKNHKKTHGNMRDSKREVLL